jgi:hypothetical protein
VSRPADPLDIVLDRELPYRAAVTGAAATAVIAAIMAARSADGRRRRRYVALAAVTGAEAVGMHIARRRRASLSHQRHEDRHTG